MFVAVVVAIRDEEKGISIFVEESRKVFQLLEERGHSCELIVVEDGSTDRTIDAVMSLKGDPNVTLIELDECTSQSMALAVGCSLAGRADVVVTMDGDRSHPWSIVPKMVEAIDEPSVEVVQGRKTQRKLVKFRNRVAVVFNYVVSVCLGVPLRYQNTIFRAVRREFLQEHLLSQESYWSFSRLSASQWRISNAKLVEFESRERTEGHSKYGIGRLIKFGFFGAVSLFPAKLLLLLIALSFLLSVVLGYCYIFVFASFGAGCLYCIRQWRFHFDRVAIRRIRVQVVFCAAKSCIEWPNLRPF